MKIVASLMSFPTGSVNCHFTFHSWVKDTSPTRVDQMPPKWIVDQMTWRGIEMPVKWWSLVNTAPVPSLEINNQVILDHFTKSVWLPKRWPTITQIFETITILIKALLVLILPKMTLLKALINATLHKCFFFISWYKYSNLQVKSVISNVNY